MRGYYDLEGHTCHFHLCYSLACLVRMATPNCTGVRPWAPDTNINGGCSYAVWSVFDLFAICSPQVRNELGWAGLLVRGCFCQQLFHRLQFTHWHCLTVCKVWAEVLRIPQGWTVSGSLSLFHCPYKKKKYIYIYCRSKQNPAPTPWAPWGAPCPPHPQDSGAGSWTRGNEDFAQQLPA